MISLDGYKKTMKNLPEGIMEAEVNAERRASILIGVTGGKVVCTDASDITSIYVRASGAKTGYAYTQNLEEAPEIVLLRAYDNGFLSENSTVDRLNTTNTAFVGKINHESIKINTDLIMQTSAELERRIMSAGTNIRTVLSEVRVDTVSSHVINSKGVDVSSVRNIYYASASVMAEAAGQEFNVKCSTSAYSMEALDLDDIVRRVAAAVKNQLNFEEFLPGEYPVVLDKAVGINIMTTAWQLFSGLKYCDGSTALKGKLGEQIGSCALSIIDVPEHSGTGYRFPFDCEGSMGKETILVDKGKLAGLMHNIASADLMGEESTGNAGRCALLSGNIPTDIIITPKICCIKPGTSTVERLLEEMGDGIYITSSSDVFHSINIGSGDFAIPCSGVVVKGGKLHHGVTALTICGNLLDVFSNIVETASDLLIDEFLLRSYCVGSPSLRLSKLQVNGK